MAWGCFPLGTDPAPVPAFPRRPQEWDFPRDRRDPHQGSALPSDSHRYSPGYSSAADAYRNQTSLRPQMATPVSPPQRDFCFHGQIPRISTEPRSASQSRSQAGRPPSDLQPFLDGPCARKATGPARKGGDRLPGLRTTREMMRLSSRVLYGRPDRPLESPVCPGLVTRSET